MSQTLVLPRERDAADEVDFWPLDAPGMPLPGAGFIAAAEAAGDPLYDPPRRGDRITPGPQLNRLYRRALRVPGFQMSIPGKGGLHDVVEFVPGHIWNQHLEDWARAQADPNFTPRPVDGPHPAEVMILGKVPWKDEVAEKRNLVGVSGEILTELVKRYRLKGASRWYVTNVVKFLPPEGETRLRAAWIKDCLPLLHQELRIVRPKYILCLGADASKCLLGEKYGVNYMAGRVVPFSFPVSISGNEEPEIHTAHVMTVLHPTEVARSPEKERILQANFGRFAYMVSTGTTDFAENDLDHRICSSLEEAEEWLAEVRQSFQGVPKKDRLLAWDLEWQGQHPINAGSYIRTIQCSWGHKQAIVFRISEPGGGCAFRDRDGKPAVKRLVRRLNALVAECRSVGHFLVADMEWAEHIGLNLRSGCEVPVFGDNKKAAWERLRDGEGWLDTAMMSHAIEETSPLGLEVLAMRYTTCARYDIPLEDWKSKYCAEKGIKSEAMEGYGDCPDQVLMPYAAHDADVTRRAAISLLPLIDKDHEGNCCWEPLWESMVIQKPILRMHQRGILVDRKRIDDLTKKFMAWKARQEEKIRVATKWPDFNVRSVQQVREYLFGESLNGRFDNETGQPVRLRPEGARSLYLEPLLDTSKPPRTWAKVRELKLERVASPGTGKMILGIMAQENLDFADDISLIRDYRFLDQVLKSYLRPPRTDEFDNWVENENGELEYDSGLAGSIDDDGRVRTHFYPTAETGRWKSARPNLQNGAKSRDPDYCRLLGGIKTDRGWEGGDYTHTLRSVLQATPGFALVECDYVGAELFAAAILSGSKQMLDHCQRSLLPDKGYDEKGKPVPGGKHPHPDYYDIHSSVAKLAFKLSCPPTKKGLSDIGKAHYRVLAKNVMFGYMYGRQAKAIALQGREQGVNVSVEEAQTVIDALIEMYPELLPFFNEAKSRALNERWIRNIFGRYRRFPSARDFKIEGEFERQAMNFPIQSAIASCVDRGIAYFEDAVERHGLENDVRLLLQIHDAVVAEARYDLVEYTVDLIRWAFVEQVEIWPADLAGNPRADGPYHLGMDSGVYDHWGEPFTKAQCRELGIPEKYGKD